MKADDAMYATEIAHELANIRKRQPDAETVRRKYREYHNRYVDHIYEGRGNKENGDAIATYYINRQAYALYAIEKGISLEVG